MRQYRKNLMISVSKTLTSNHFINQPRLAQTNIHVLSLRMFEITVQGILSRD